MKAVLLVALQRFCSNAASSNSGMGMDCNVGLDLAVQCGVVFCAHTKLTKALKFLQLYADMDSGGAKGHKAVSRCHAVMRYHHKKMLFVQQQLQANFAQNL